MLDVVAPLSVISVYLLYELAESTVMAVADKETADSVRVTEPEFSFILLLIIINMPQLLGTVTSDEATLVT